MMNITSAYPSRFTSAPPCVRDEPSSTSGLPQQFVKSMKTLFHILDDSGTGLVPLVEIERRWRDDAVPNLPGVLDSLRDVAPANGLLSFDTFVVGLRTALTRARQSKEQRILFNNSNGYVQRNSSDDKDCLPDHRPYRNTGKPVYRQYSVKKNAYEASELPKSKSINEGMRGILTGPQQLVWNEHNYQLNSRRQQSTTDNVAYSSQGRSDNRSANSRHTRSNSGSQHTATVMPTQRNKDFPLHDEGIRITKMGFATKFSAHDAKVEGSEEKMNDLLKSDDSSSLDDIKPEYFDGKYSSSSKSSLCDSPDGGLRRIQERSESIVNQLSKNAKLLERNRAKKLSSDAVQNHTNGILDNVTASTLMVGKDDFTYSRYVNAVDICGKFPTVTGTNERLNACAIITSRYGSLRRPAMSSASKSLFPSSDYCSEGADHQTERRRRKGGRYRRNGDDCRRRQYASAGESGDESNTRILPLPRRPSSCDRSRGTDLDERNALNLSNIETDKKEADVPQKSFLLESTRSSLSPTDEQEKETKTDSAPAVEESQTPLDAKVEENQSEPKQLLVPPPSGRSLNIRASAELSKGYHLVNDENIPHYATLGRGKKPAVNKRKDPRRHTLANGLDYNALKCIRQLDRQKELLHQGLKILDEGRAWFQRCLNDVDTCKNKIVSDDSSSAVSDENKDIQPATPPSEEDLEALLKNIREFGRIVKSTCTTEKIIKTVTSDGSKVELTSDKKSFQEDDLSLTKEVTKLSDQVAQLEREKALLVQQLFQAKAETQAVKGEMNTSIFI